jgi:hypothetical protein
MRASPDILDLVTPLGDDAGELAEAPPPAPAEVEHTVSGKWRIRVQDKVYGPYPRSRLIDFLKEGRVVAGTLIACGRESQFVRADAHPQLRWDFPAGPRRRRFGEPRLDPGEQEAPVCNYFIAARLLGSNEAVERSLRDFGKVAKAAGDMWVVRSRLTVQQLRNQLSAVMRPHEHFVIVNATKDRLAWFNLGAENDIAIRGVWDSDEVR